MRSLPRVRYRSEQAQRRLLGPVGAFLLMFLICGDEPVPIDSLPHLAHAEGYLQTATTRTEWFRPETRAGHEVQRRPCPSDMVLVEGNYCPRVEHQCAQWLDDPKLPYARCGQYERQARCRSGTERLRFCIDREEYTRPGETVPANFLSFTLAVRLCRANNKRLCEEREWNFACEGEEMRPYPYGWSREPKCNQDREDLFEVRLDMQKPKQVLRDHRAPNDAFAQCVSPFGVHNLVGNLDEPVVREGTSHATMRMSLKGGWWLPGRNRCRPATTAHDVYYRDVQVGARCCADVADER